MRKCRQCSGEFSPTQWNQRFCSIQCKNKFGYWKNPETVRAKVAKWRLENLKKRKVYEAKWKLENRTKIKAYNAKWRLENPQKRKAAAVAWRLKNREKIIVRQLKYDIENREKKNARAAQDRLRNPEKFRARARKYRIENREKVRSSLERYYINGPLNPKGELQWLRKSKALLRTVNRIAQKINQGRSLTTSEVSLMQQTSPICV